MNFEVLNESIRIKNSFGEFFEQKIIENDIIVPDSKEDVSSVLLADSEINISSIDLSDDKVTVRGEILYKIIYNADNEEHSIKGINVKNDFSYKLDATGARHGADCTINCEVLHINCEILNSRKINAKAIVNFIGKINQIKEIEVVNGIRSTDNIELLKEPIEVISYVGKSCEECFLKQTFELPSSKPPIGEILRNDVVIKNSTYKISDQKIELNANLNVSTLYMSETDERKIQCIENVIPFSEIVSFENLREDQICDINYNIKNYTFEKVQDSDGEYRNIYGEISLGIDIETLSKKRVDMIEDAYSQEFRVNFEKELISTNRIISQVANVVNIKESIQIDDKRLANVIYATYNPSLLEKKMFEDKIVVEGLVNIALLYETNNDELEVHSEIKEVPFRCEVLTTESKMGKECFVDMKVIRSMQNSNYQNQIEVFVDLEVNVRVVEASAVQVTTKAIQLPYENQNLREQPSVIVYFCDEGDTVWKVAKKYCTSVDNIKKANNLEESNQLVKGQQVIVYNY